jgi:hypothetical protein
VSAAVREQSSKRGDKCTIGWAKPGALLLTSQNRETSRPRHGKVPPP